MPHIAPQAQGCLWSANVLPLPNLQSSAIRDMRAERQAVPAGFLAAPAHVSVTVRATRLALITPTGAYDRAVIMQLAIRAARAQQARTGEAWAICMSAGLTAAWNVAKIARLNRAH